MDHCALFEVRRFFPKGCPALGTSRWPRGPPAGLRQAATPRGSPSPAARKGEYWEFLGIFPETSRTAGCHPNSHRTGLPPGGGDGGRPSAPPGGLRCLPASLQGEPPVLGAARSPPRPAAPSPFAACQPGTPPGSAATAQPGLLRRRPPRARLPAPRAAAAASAAQRPRPVPPGGSGLPAARGRGSVWTGRHLGGVPGGRWAPPAFPGRRLCPGAGCWPGEWPQSSEGQGAGCWRGRHRPRRLCGPTRVPASGKINTHALPSAGPSGQKFSQTRVPHAPKYSRDAIDHLLMPSSLAQSYFIYHPLFFKN